MIASHNSFTYLKPKKWWMRIGRFMAKCQSKTIQEQYEKYNARLFDLRVDFDKNDNVILRHGLAVYKITESELYSILDFLNTREDKVFLDITFECSYKESKNLPEHKLELFKRFCEYVKNTYTHITFLGGFVKYLWINIYNFNTSLDASSVSKFASVATKNKIDDLWPWLFAKIHNKKSVAENPNKYVWIDFVEIQ